MPESKREKRGGGGGCRRGKRSLRRGNNRSATPALFTITEEEEGQRRRGAYRSKKKGMMAKIKRDMSSEPVLYLITMLIKSLHVQRKSPLSHLETVIDVWACTCACVRVKELTKRGRVSTRASDVNVHLCSSDASGSSDSFCRHNRYRCSSVLFNTAKDQGSSSSRLAWRCLYLRASGAASHVLPFCCLELCV